MLFSYVNRFGVHVKRRYKFNNSFQKTTMDYCTAVFRHIAALRVQVMCTLDATLRSVLFNRLLSSVPDTANYLTSLSRTYQREITIAD